MRIHFRGAARNEPGRDCRQPKKSLATAARMSPGRCAHETEFI